MYVLTISAFILLMLLPFNAANAAAQKITLKTYMATQTDFYSAACSMIEKHKNIVPERPQIEEKCSPTCTS